MATYLFLCACAVRGVFRGAFGGHGVRVGGDNATTISMHFHEWGRSDPTYLSTSTTTQ